MLYSIICAVSVLCHLQDIHTNAQEASGAIANDNSSSTATAPAGRSKATSAKSAAADNISSKAKRQAMLLAAADVLLTCAVQGATLANRRSADAAAAAIAAITAAAQRAGVPVPQQEVENAVQPPLTPKEQMSWLRLAANAFKAAGRVLEAGKLLLGFGPDIEDGRYWQVAKKLLTSLSNENAAVAAVFEDAARQELGLGRSSRSSGSGETGPAAAAEGVHGSFLSASRLLREALALYKQAGMWGDCWRLLNEYEGLRPLLKQKAVDEITLVSMGCCSSSMWCSLQNASLSSQTICCRTESIHASLPVDTAGALSLTSCSSRCLWCCCWSYQAWIHSAKRPGVSRDEVLKAINTLRDPAVREGTLRMLGFWRVRKLTHHVLYIHVSICILHKIVVTALLFPSSHLRHAGF